MKKTIYGVLVLSLFLIPLGVSANFDQDLYYGLRNNSQVVELQEFLTTEGLYSGPLSGNFFSMTLKAVKAFQTRELVSPVSGRFGPLTRAKANLLLDVQDVPEIVTPAPSTQSQIDGINSQLAILMVQLEEMRKKSTQPIEVVIQQPTVVAQPEPILAAAQPVKTLDVQVFHLDPETRMNIPWNGETLNGGFATVSFGPIYRIDGVRQRTFSATLSSTSQADINGMAAGFNCTAKVQPDPEKCDVSRFGVQFHSLGEHNVTVTVEGVSKTFTFNVN